jgi:serine/threonine-protein kinase
VTRALGSRYRLEELIGVGAMGTVYRTTELATGDQLAAKVLKPELTQDPEIVGRFVQERSILTGLDHPNIVRVKDLVVEGDDLAIVMELVHGHDLRTHLRRRGTFAPAEAVRVTVAVLEALASAHQKNCLHRDVKPDNVLVEGEDPTRASAVKLSDFSISRLSEASSIKATGLLGTPEYMPPELFSQGTFSAASDVYAVGIMLYELLAGRTPFAGVGNGYTIGQRHVGSLPPALDVPAALWAVLSRMLAKDPSVRLPAADAAAVLAGLEGEIEDAAAGPRQEEPAAWAPAAAVAPTGSSAGHLPAMQDVGATQIKVAGPALEPLPTSAGDAVALAPGEQLAVGETNVVSRAAKHDAPRLEPQVPVEVRAPAKIDLRSPVVVAAIGVVVVLAVVLVVLLKPWSGGGTDGAAASQVAAQASLASPATSRVGLSISRSATYSAGDGGAATLVFSIGVGSNALSGPFLLAVPPVAGGSDCPSVTWSVSGVRRDIDQINEAPRACAWRVPSAAVSSDGLVVRATVTGRIGSDAQTSLQDWLQSSVQSTDAALAKVQATATDYAAQRVESFSVELSSTTVAIGNQIRVGVKPNWAGGGTGPTIYSYPESDGVSLTERLLGAKPELDSRCSTEIVKKYGAFIAHQQTGSDNSCTITATLADASGESSPISVS